MGEATPELAFVQKRGPLSPELILPYMNMINKIAYIALNFSHTNL